MLRGGRHRAGGLRLGASDCGPRAGWQGRQDGGDQGCRIAAAEAGAERRPPHNRGGWAGMQAIKQTDDWPLLAEFE
eukprot:13601625-Alexandrium_andersonii.AAC.1